MHSSFLSTFRWILLGSGALSATGCGPSCADPYSTTQLRTVPTDTLLKALADAELTLEECAALCEVPDYLYVASCGVTFSSPPGITGYPMEEPESAAEDAATIRCETVQTSICEGRRHVSWGLRERASGEDPVGRWLAESAANEAGSVHSFRSLARELEGHLSGLRSALHRAARQEIGHTRLLDRLARVRGSERIRQAFVPTLPRTLLELALENAREGCVNETYAGLVALHQAGHAQDSGIRSAFSLIAREEAEHADLAWALHAQLRLALPEDARAHLDRELHQAALRLERDTLDLSKGFFAGLPELTARRCERELGLPTASTACRTRHTLAALLQARAERLAA